MKFCNSKSAIIKRVSMLVFKDCDIIRSRYFIPANISLFKILIDT